VDEKLRRIIEAARLDVEFALQELRRYGLARADVAERHVANVAAALDEILLKTKGPKPPNMRN
jgi:hypothetical protein